MKLTTKGRYAVMALADLAKFNNGAPVSLRDISLRQGISLLYLEQIFSKLKNNNIVKSIATQIFIKAVLYNPFTESIITWVVENIKYIRAGGHNWLKTILLIL